MGCVVVIYLIPMLFFQYDKTRKGFIDFFKFQAYDELVVGSAHHPHLPHFFGANDGK